MIGFVHVRVVSLPSAHRSYGSCGFAWVDSGASRGRRVDAGSRRAGLVVVEFILCLVGSLGRSLVSSGSFGVTWIPFSRLGIVGFILDRVGLLVRA